MPPAKFVIGEEQAKNAAAMEVLLAGCLSCCCSQLFWALDILALVVGVTVDSHCAKKGSLVKPRTYLIVAGVVSLVLAFVVLWSQRAYVAADSYFRMVGSQSNDVSLKSASLRYFALTFVSALFSCFWGFIGILLFVRLTHGSDSCGSSYVGRVAVSWGVIHLLTSVVPVLSSIHAMCSYCNTDKIVVSLSPADTGDSLTSKLLYHE